MINMVFLGPPGAGKGTQSANIMKDYDIVQISTGDILRQAVREGTELGISAKKYMDEGKLVPDELIINMMKERLAASDCTDGFILDGFPRTVEQAKALDNMLKGELDTELTHIISLEVPDELLKERLTLRRSCPDCGKGYHMKYDPPRSNDKCHKCGVDVIQRDDDTEDVISKRLRVYHEQTSVLKEYYEASGKLYRVNGNADPAEVYRAIREVLG